MHLPFSIQPARSPNILYSPQHPILLLCGIFQQECLQEHNTARYKTGDTHKSSSNELNCPQDGLKRTANELEQQQKHRLLVRITHYDARGDLHTQERVNRPPQTFPRWCVIHSWNYLELREVRRQCMIHRVFHFKGNCDWILYIKLNCNFLFNYISPLMPWNSCDCIKPPCSGLGLLKTTYLNATQILQCCGLNGRPLQKPEQVRDGKDTLTTWVEEDKDWKEGMYERWSLVRDCIRELCTSKSLDPAKSNENYTLCVVTFSRPVLLPTTE